VVIPPEPVKKGEVRREREGEKMGGIASWLPGK